MRPNDLFIYTNRSVLEYLHIVSVYKYIFLHKCVCIYKPLAAQLACGSQAHTSVRITSYIHIKAHTSNIDIAHPASIYSIFRI